MPGYKCRLCNKIFKQKTDLKRHGEKKQSCISTKDIINLVSNTDDILKLKTIFSYCLNVLRDNEGLTGDKALRNMTYLLTLKMLEKQFDNEIDICNEDYYDFSEAEDEEYHKSRLFSLIYFSNLVIEPENNLPEIFKSLWSDILSIHPQTSHIFLPDKFFDIKHKSTYKKLIDKINSFQDIDNDILGDAYENLISDTMTGKVLGQFFTPCIAKEIMLELVNPQVFKDGTIETCCDPTMGTAGFLVSYLKRIRENASLLEISLNWDFITNMGLYGKEIEPDTYQLACSNMLLSSGHVFNNLERGDSIRQPIKDKFDIIMANPPFGIKGLKYDDFTSSIKFQYIPIKTDNAVSLFIQAIIYMLKIEGRCAIVLPDGQDLFSKTNKTLVQIREYLLKTCDLQEIIYLPSGIFTNTGIKTCIFYFIKKEEGTNVITRIIKGNNIIYDMSINHVTKCVKFYQYDETDDCKKLIINVDIEDIVKNNYSLNYNEYIEKETVEYNTNIEWMTLGELCEIQNGTRITKSNSDKGIFDVFGSGRATFTTTEYNRENYNILIGRFALSKECVRLTNHKLFLNDSGLTIRPKIDNLLHKYIGYYVYINQDIIYSCARGTAQKNLDMIEFQDLQIPVPSLQIQNEIVEYLDFLHKSIETAKQMINENKKLNEFFINHNTKSNDIEIKTLNEICDINALSNNLKNVKMINYIDIASVKENNYKCNTLYSDFPSRARRVVSSENILYSTVRPNLKGYVYIEKAPLNCIASTGFVVLKIKQKLKDKILSKYCYYAIERKEINDTLVMCAKGSQYPAVSVEDFANLHIPIPSLRIQRQIISYCDNNNNDIIQLNKKINNTKKLIKSYIDNIIYGKQDDQLVVTYDMTHDEKIKTLCQLLRENRDTNVIDYYKCFTPLDN